MIEINKIMRENNWHGALDTTSQCFSVPFMMD